MQKIIGEGGGWVSNKQNKGFISQIFIYFSMAFTGDFEDKQKKGLWVGFGKWHKKVNGSWSNSWIKGWLN